MYKFVTIRCKCCGAVICNLPQSEVNIIKRMNFMCEDCKDNPGMREYMMESHHRAGKNENNECMPTYSAN